MQIYNQIQLVMTYYSGAAGAEYLHKYRTDVLHERLPTQFIQDQLKGV